MESRRLKESIEIYSIPVEDTPYGQINEVTPIFKYETRAGVIFDGQARVASEGEIFYPTDRTFVVRSYVPIVERDRIKWDDKWWRIISINTNKYFHDKEIRCAEQND